MNAASRGQRGFALIGALFVLVVVAALGAFAVRINMTQQHDADNPLTSGQQPLWTCDLWEHAYYLDYQQERATFVKAVIDSIANWQFVGKQLVEADAQPRRAAARPTGS